MDEADLALEAELDQLLGQRDDNVTKRLIGKSRDWAERSREQLQKCVLFVVVDNQLNCLVDHSRFWLNCHRKRPR